MKQLIVILLAAALTSCGTLTPTPATAPCALDSNVPLVGGEIKAPRVIHRVEPRIPQHLFGSSHMAVVEALIGTDGRVKATCRVSGHPEWGAVVAEALRQWVFEPATRDGQPVEVRFGLTSHVQ
jgi:hypothetical protein